jgi:hypothetical protein
MTERHHLANRRASTSFSFRANGLSYHCTYSKFPDGALGEVFLNNAKVSSQSDAAAKDSAVVCSLALQYGVPLDTIRHALLRDSHGVASSPLGVALDFIAGEEARA